MTAAQPLLVTLCLTEAQNHGAVSVHPSRAPLHAVYSLLDAGETPEVVAQEHGLTVDEVLVLDALRREITARAGETA